MQPPKKPAYSAPRLATFSDREEVLKHFARTGEPAKITQTWQFLSNAEGREPALPELEVAKKAAQR